MYDIWDRSDRFRYKEANGQCAVVSPCVCTVVVIKEPECYQILLNIKYY